MSRQEMVDEIRDHLHDLWEAGEISNDEYNQGVDMSYKTDLEVRTGFKALMEKVCG